MKLALGTVQFGLAYGIAGSGSVVAEAEVRRIVAIAADRGVDCIDTAAGYGDIEQRIAQLAPQASFSFVSKIPAVPVKDAATFVRESVETSIARLGSRLRALMFHRQEDLAGANALEIWQSARDAIGARPISLGVSAYEPQTLQAIAARFPVAVAQLPCNAFDQRAAAVDGDRLEVHVRSAFLQGLLLQDPGFAATKLPAAAAAVSRWRSWCDQRSVSPLQGALSVVKAIGERHALSHCVVGVETAAQFEEIADAWDAAQPIPAPELAITDPSIIDPRTWKRAAEAAA
jgi:aryl-alcohol dehydrogenase-like predicted oxidoreductase